MTASDHGAGPDAEHTVLSVLRGAEGWLTRAGVDGPKRSAELLLGKVLGLSRLQLYLAHDRPLDPAERTAMRTLVARRGKGEPVAYLLGTWSFRGHEVAVGPSVLIPRPETEELVEHALAALPANAVAIDLGTGSGAIAIALAVARPDLRVLAVDISEAALGIASANVARHGVGERVQLLRGSWWEPVPADATFDLVISNPPYIDPVRPTGLAADVQAFEPALALFSAPGDVASCYRAIFAPLASRLRAGGAVWCETGLGAAAPALQALRATGLVDVELRCDLAGAERFLCARQRAEPTQGA